MNKLEIVSAALVAFWLFGRPDTATLVELETPSAIAETTEEQPEIAETTEEQPEIAETTEEQLEVCSGSVWCERGGARRAARQPTIRRGGTRRAARSWGCRR